MCPACATACTASCTVSDVLQFRCNALCAEDIRKHRTAVYMAAKPVRAFFLGLGSFAGGYWIPLGPLPRKARLKGAHPKQHKCENWYKAGATSGCQNRRPSSRSQKVCTSTWQHAANTAESKFLAAAGSSEVRPIGYHVCTID